MSEVTAAFVGLDVHKESIAIAVAEPGRAAPRFLGATQTRSILANVEKALAHVGAPQDLLIVHEAGPCGYVLARQLAARGYRCDVVAPTMIPRKPGDRIKTDRRDALALAHFARVGDLTPVLVPQAPDDAIRDLSRAREDAVRARLKSRQQPPKPVTLMPGMSSSSRLGRIATPHGSVANCRSDKKVNRAPCATSPGGRSCACANVTGVWACAVCIKIRYASRSSANSSASCGIWHVRLFRSLESIDTNRPHTEVLARTIKDNLDWKRDARTR